MHLLIQLKVHVVITHIWGNCSGRHLKVCELLDTRVYKWVFLCVIYMYWYCVELSTCILWQGRISSPTNPGPELQSLCWSGILKKWEAFYGDNLSVKVDQFYVIQHNFVLSITKYRIKSALIYQDLLNRKSFSMILILLFKENGWFITRVLFNFVTCKSFIICIKLLLFIA
jgi:hypothetical protein